MGASPATVSLLHAPHPRRGIRVPRTPGPRGAGLSGKLGPGQLIGAGSHLAGMPWRQRGQTTWARCATGQPGADSRPTSFPAGLRRSS
eukprot:4538438-Alexandrium_andersonii.AAC.1